MPNQEITQQGFTKYGDNDHVSPLQIKSQTFIKSKNNMSPVTEGNNFE